MHTEDVRERGLRRDIGKIKIEMVKWGHVARRAGVELRKKF
jgi:hypothetical protein